MRLIGILFLCLTIVAGLTFGTVEIALINIVLFMALALIAAHFLAPRFGKNGVIFGMAGAFFMSCLWPAALHFGRDAPSGPSLPQATIKKASAQ